MLKLQAMTEDEYLAYKAWLVEDYAGDLSRNFRLPMDEARANSAREIDGALSQGLSTPNLFFYNILLAADGGESRLGYLWIEVDSQRKRCFINDIYLHAEFRHQGWGRKVLELLETDMKQQGITRIGLSVFGDNTNAQEFYRKMGYVVTNMNMVKWLGE